jgi:hypothetical protein
VRITGFGLIAFAIFLDQARALLRKTISKAQSGNYENVTPMLHRNRSGFTENVSHLNAALHQCHSFRVT